MILTYQLAMPQKMSTTQLSPVHQVIDLFQKSLLNLGYEPNLAEAEQIGLLIFGAMEGSRRRFHTVKHVFDVCEGMNAMQTIAALFHDVVYYQIDKSFPPNTADLLLPFIEVQQNTLLIRADAPKSQPFDLCLAVFGFQRGQNLLAFNGQNEFLSACVCALLLDKLLTLNHLVAIITCIEATIPFRKPTKNEAQQEVAFYDNLEQRLNQLALKFGKAWQKPTTDEMVKQAVLLANNDVKNFAAADVGIFLDGTWTLLPETYTELGQGGLYSTANYRNALSRMESFFSVLQAENVFHQYQNTPSNEKFESLLANTKNNLQTGRDYIGAKLLPIAIIEAAAMLTGGDAPLSFFVGDLRFANKNINRAEDFLPQIANAGTKKPTNDLVFDLLEYGRTSPTNFDLQTSPLASFLYQQLGNTACQEFLGEAKAFFEGKITAIAFLAHKDDKVRKVICHIIEACAAIALTRKDKLLALSSQLAKLPTDKS
jgi:hypothetical protein